MSWVFLGQKKKRDLEKKGSICREDGRSVVLNLVSNVANVDFFQVGTRRKMRVGGLSVFFGHLPTIQIQFGICSC